MFKKISGRKPTSLVREETIRVQAIRAQANMNATLQRCLDDTDTFIKKQVPQAAKKQKEAVENIGLLARTASKLIGKK